MRASSGYRDLEGCCEWESNHSREDAVALLHQARNALDGRGDPFTWLQGSLHERAWLALHEAEWRGLLVMDSEQLLARLPGLIAMARGSLGPDDQRVRSTEDLLKRSQRRHRHPDRLQFEHKKSPHQEADLDNGHRLPLVPATRFRLTKQERATIAAMVRDAYSASDEQYAASRGFRNRILMLMIAALCLLAALIAAAAIWNWQLTPTDQVEVNGVVAKWADSPVPQGGAVFAGVSLLGAVGAFLSGIRSVARTGGTRNPFSLSWWQMWLKLPVGAITAIVGLFALQSRAFPAVPATRWTELLLWAVAFGAAQQAVTRLVDQRVRDVVGNSGDSEEGTSRTGSQSAAGPTATAASTTGPED